LRYNLEHNGHELMNFSGCTKRGSINDTKKRCGVFDEVEERSAVTDWGLQLVFIQTHSLQRRSTAAGEPQKPRRDLTFQPKKRLIIDATVQFVGFKLPGYVSVVLVLAFN